MPPIWDENNPIRPPERPDLPPDEPIQPDPDPPSQWNPDFDEGLIPNPEPDTDIPIPDPEPPYDWLLLGDTSTLTTKYETYGGVGAKCRSYSKNWTDMTTVPYWLEGSVSGMMNGSTLVLETPTVTDQWLSITDSVFGVVADNSYIEMDIVYSVSGGVSPTLLGTIDDDSRTFSVCLEGGDSLNAAISGGQVSDFSIVKNGMERINFSEISVANTVWTEHTITITITKSVHCSFEDESVQDDDEDFVQSDSLIEWSQNDSWVLLGFIVLILIGSFTLNTVRGGDDG